MEEALNDLQMAAGEIAFRALDLQEQLDRNTVKISPALTKKLNNLAKTTCEVMDELAEVRKKLGLPERPKD